MDENTFLKLIAESPRDQEIVQEFATWLINRNDKRGKYLQLELDRRNAERQLAEIGTKLLEYQFLNGVNSAWLDQLQPLEVVAPIPGRFYTARNPNESPYVKAGDFCTPNTVVGIIEAMHVFNEIPAEVSGVISAVLVSSGDAVEYGQPLFRLSRPPQLLTGG